MSRVVGGRAWGALAATILLVSCAPEPTVTTPPLLEAESVKAAAYPGPTRTTPSSVEAEPPQAAAYPGPTGTIAGATPFAAGGIPRTYRNDSGYSVEVPAGWYVWDERSVGGHPGAGATLTSYDMDAVTGSGGVPLHLTKIDIWVDESDRDSELADVVDASVAEPDGMCGPDDRDVLLREDWTLEDGTPAIRYQLLNCDSWESAHLVAGMGGKLVQMVGFGGLERFDEVARSLTAAP